MTRCIFRAVLLGIVVCSAAVITPSTALPYAICVGCVGWDGAGLGSADLIYHFGVLTGDNGLTDAQVKAAVVSAMDAWAQVAAITWTESATAGLPRSVDIEWDTGYYGPWHSRFPSGALAVSYYPTPNNREPLAGNIYFNDGYDWSLDGSGYDIFTVALHELGHTLGLAHSTDPSSVMYPVYHPVTGLTPDDIAGILSLYAPGPVTPLSEPPGDEGSSPVSVPEPGTLLLLASGLASLGACIRHRNKIGHHKLADAGRTRVSSI